MPPKTKSVGNHWSEQTSIGIFTAGLLSAFNLLMRPVTLQRELGLQPPAVRADL